MKLLLDVNVVLDVTLLRQPHLLASAKVLDACERRLATACLCATSLTTLHYLAAKAKDRATARRLLENLLRFCEVADVHNAVVRAAIRLNWMDFEDAILHEAATLAQCDTIVTRNTQDFNKSKLPVQTPAEICTLLNL